MCTMGIFPFNGIAFLEILAELQETEPLIPLHILLDQNKIFIPFQLDEDLNLRLSDSHSDAQFYNSQCNNSLYSRDYYLKWFYGPYECITKNLNKSDLYLLNLNHDFQIIALSETWLNDHNWGRYGIDWWNAEYYCRPNRASGGVSLCINDTIEYTVRGYLCFKTDILETLFDYSSI